VIRLTEGTLELTLLNDILIFRLDHLTLDAISASSVVATTQNERLSVLEIKEKFALSAHEIRHLYIYVSIKFYY
jgi:hypothetical protein